MTADRPRAIRVLAIADTDSYLKWAAATVGSLPEEWMRDLALVDTAAAPSATQIAAALRGSGVDAGAVGRFGPPDVAREIARRGPDVVLVATRGPVAAVIMRTLLAAERRPVIATGLPGISIPATLRALQFRRHADLFVVHSAREARDFGDLAAGAGFPMRFALAHLPFLDRRPATPSGRDLVFAAQAIVPRTPPDRRRVARLLIAAARADPERRVVVKLRAVAREHQTHAERLPYPRILERERDVPPNLVISTEPMSDALDRAEGLVTVSSTAILEAIARGVPAIALDSFGVAPELINTGLVGSGLLGGDADVVARRFRHPDPGWMRDNYFHDPEADDLVERLTELVAARDVAALPARPVARPVGGSLRAAWDTRIAFGRADRSLAGVVALAIGIPARAAVRAGRRVARVLRPPRAAG